MLTFNNKIVLSNNKWIEKPLPPIGAKTARMKFSNPSFNPKNYSWWNVSANAWTEVAPGIWDYHNNSNDWTKAFANRFDGEDAPTSVAFIDSNLEGITNLGSLFQGNNTNAQVTSLEGFNLPSTLTNATMMFQGCRHVQHFPSMANVHNLTGAFAMFAYCESMTEVPEGLDVSGVADLNQLFISCKQLTSITIDAAAATNINSLAANCDNLQLLTLQNTGNIQSMQMLCSNCHELTSLPTISSTGVTDCYASFSNCYKVNGGALAMYNQLSSQSTLPTQYDRCFRNCGRDTTTGAAELAQIPSGWK